MLPPNSFSCNYVVVSNLENCKTIWVKFKWRGKTLLECETEKKEQISIWEDDNWENIRYALDVL